MSAMSTIELALKEHNIPEGLPTEQFISLVAMHKTSFNSNLDSAIEWVVANNPQLTSLPELCGDCLYPANWSKKTRRWTCNRCDA
jgi:hypothetical protein